MNVLFLCTHNAARSLMAEALLNHLGGERFRAFSAGSHPAGAPNPLALEALERHGIPASGLRSKCWDEFGSGGGVMDLVITVCDDAAAETCPVWPGAPITAHWGVPDPSRAEGTHEARLRVFMRTLMTLRRRIDLLLALPETAFEARVKAIGRE